MNQLCVHTRPCILNLLPPPSPPRPSRLSQSTGFGCPASRTELTQVIYFTYGNIYVSVILKSSPLPFSLGAQSVFFMAVSPSLSCAQDCRHHLSTQINLVRKINSTVKEGIPCYMKERGGKGRWGDGAWEGFFVNLALGKAFQSSLLSLHCDCEQARGDVTVYPSALLLGKCLPTIFSPLGGIL